MRTIALWFYGFYTIWWVGIGVVWLVKGVATNVTIFCAIVQSILLFGYLFIEKFKEKY